MREREVVVHEIVVHESARGVGHSAALAAERDTCDGHRRLRADDALRAHQSVLQAVELRDRHRLREEVGEIVGSTAKDHLDAPVLDVITNLEVAAVDVARRLRNEVGLFAVATVPWLST